MPATPIRARDGDADNADDQDDDDEYTARAAASAAQTTPRQGVASPAGSSHTTARTPGRTTTVVTTDTPTRRSTSTEELPSSSALRRSSRGPRGELHTPPVLLPSLSFGSTTGAASSSPSPVTTATGSSTPYGWQDGGGRAQSPSTSPPPSQQQQQHRQRPARDSSYADGDGFAMGPSARGRDSDRDREHDERTAIPSSHPLAFTNSTGSTFSSASSSSSASASASASSDNDWARSWIDADHGHDLGRAYEQQQRGFNSNWGLAAPSFDAPPANARADTTTTLSRHSDLDPRARDLAEKEEEEEEEEGEEGRRRVQLGEIWQEGAGARELHARTAEAGKATTSGEQKQKQEEEKQQEQELGRLLRGNNNDAAEEEEELEEDLADLTPMIGGGFGSPPPAIRSDEVDADALPTGATAPRASLPATTTTTVVLPTIEPLFSNRTRQPTPPAPVTDESESHFAAARLGAVQSRSEEATAAVPSSSRPLSEFDWAAAYADGEGGGGAGASITPPHLVVEAKSAADVAPERKKAPEVLPNFAAPTTAVSSRLDSEPTPPSREVNAIRDEAAPLDPLPPPRQQREEVVQDPMAMLDSLIYQSSLASEPGPMESTTAPTAHSTRQSRDDSSSSPSAVPNPILLPGAVVAAAPLSPASPTANASTSTNGNGNGNGRKERGPAPIIPVKSSRRASLLGRRRQSADSQTLLQRAASMAIATSPRSAVAGGTAMPSDPSSSSSSSLNEEGSRARTVNPPSHARSGSVPVSASATSPGPASRLSSPSAGVGAATTSPTLSRSVTFGLSHCEAFLLTPREDFFFPWERPEIRRVTTLPRLQTCTLATACTTRRRMRHLELRARGNPRRSLVQRLRRALRRRRVPARTRRGNRELKSNSNLRQSSRRWHAPHRP